jgi:protein TonB
VKAEYTEDARQRRITGDVILEIVVQRDGSVGEVKLLQGLSGGLNERAVQAVRQWRFAAARRQGSPVDVIVDSEVSRYRVSFRSDDRIVPHVDRRDRGPIAQLQ